MTRPDGPETLTPAADPQSEPRTTEEGYLESGTGLGPYRIKGLLGRGGMGEVYEAEHTALGRRVAIKVLRADLCRDKDAVGRFFGEARAVNRINHPGLIEITDLVDDGPITYYVMEFLEGETLAARMQAAGRYSVSEFMKHFDQIVETLEAVHRAGIVHRDIKPENIFVMETARGDRTKILDFGVAKLKRGIDTNASMETAAGSLIGTPAYMSPEQATSGIVGPASDIYSLGIVMYEALAGKLPFTAGNLGEYLLAHMTATPAPFPEDPEAPIPPALERIVLDCLEKRPEDRPPSMEALGLRLRESLWNVAPTEEHAAGIGVPNRPTPVDGTSRPDHPTPATTESPAELIQAVIDGPVGPPTSRSGAGKAIAAMIAVGALVAIGVVALPSEDGPPQPTGPVETPTPEPQHMTAVTLRSTPVGAKVVDVATGVELGVTPFVGELETKTLPLEVRLELEGYRTRPTVLRAGLSDVALEKEPEKKPEDKADQQKPTSSGSDAKRPPRRRSKPTAKPTPTPKPKPDETKPATPKPRSKDAIIDPFAP